MTGVAPAMRGEEDEEDEVEEEEEKKKEEDEEVEQVLVQRQLVDPTKPAAGSEHRGVQESTSAKRGSSERSPSSRSPSFSTGFFVTQAQRILLPGRAAFGRHGAGRRRPGDGEAQQRQNVSAGWLRWFGGPGPNGESGSQRAGPLNPLSETGLTSQLESFAVKHRVKCRLAEDEDAKANVDLHDEVIRLKREQQFQTSYWIKKVAELQREKTEALSQSRSDFLLLVEEREKDVNSLRDQVRDLKAEMEVVQSTRAASGPRSRLRTAHVMNFLQDNATVVMNWALLRDLLDHLESGTQVPREWQTVITVMAYDNLVFQAPPFVRMDPPADDGDEETKERGPPGSVIDLSQDPSSKTSGSKRTRSGKQNRLEETARRRPAHDGGRPGISGRAERGGAGQVSLHEVSPVRTRPHVAVGDVLASSGYYIVTKYIPRRYLTVALTSLETLVRSEGHLPEWDSLPNLHPDEAELKTLELKEDEKFEVEDKDEEYDPQQDPDDGVDDEYDDEDDDSGNDSPPSIAKRTSMSGSLSTSSAEPGAPKKFKSKKSKKSQSELQSGSESESHAEVKSRSKSGSEIESTTKSKRSKRRNSGGPTELAAKGADNLTADEDRLIETQGPTCAPDELREFMGTRLWEKMMDLRRGEFYFHRRTSMGDRAVRLIEAWVDMIVGTPLGRVGPGLQFQQHPKSVCQTDQESREPQEARRHEGAADGRARHLEVPQAHLLLDS
ncbi:hypothetical protein ON010_g8563 [Phytophthora cinnamomi]|nr:hypothetical protein ON010_g8563 [Phytophthora cinnamomi]